MSGKRYNITKNQLVKILKKNNYNIGNVLKDLKCTKGVVVDRIKKYNIKWNKKKTQFENYSKAKTKYFISKDKLLNILTKNNYNLSRIEEYFNCSVTVIMRLIKKYDIKWNKKKTQKENKSFATKNRSKETLNKIRFHRINSIIKSKNYFFNYSEIACKEFNLLNEKLNLKGEHALNKGEKIIQIQDRRYSLDYYEPTLNLVIEWHGEKHYINNKLSDKDKLKQEIVIEKLNCKYINIRSKYYSRKSLHYLVLKLIMS